MTGEPWKKASRLSRLKRRPGRPAASAQAGGPRRRKGTGALISVLILLLAGGGLAWLWYSRGWWIPRYRDRLPVAVSDQIEEPRVYPDFVALEQGMDAGLVMFGDYLDLIAKTRDWRDDWQVTQTGPDTLRLENAGVVVYVMGGKIDNYHIDLERLFADEKWAGWQQSWEDAGLTPDLTWPAYSGEQEMPGGLTEDTVTSREPVKRGASWVRPAWVLQFHNGWLRRIEARIEFGAATGEDG